MGLINSIGAFFRKVTGGWEFGTQISKLLFTKNVEIVGTDDMLYEYQFQEKSGTIAHLDDISNDVTYAELHTLIDSSQLIAGAFYRVTDFSTIHRILNTVDINFGPIEPMVTFATASDQVSSFARSITYPQDIIEINWNSRLAEDGITPRAGTIVYREDTLRRIRVQGFDFRNTRWRRWKILSKQYEVPVATGPDSFTITLTFSANLTSTYLDRYREWSVKFPVDAVHDAGPINITVTKGAFTFTRPLLQSNNSTTWTANQLANLTGPLVYCPVRDVFLLMNIGQTGEQIVGLYAARLGGEVLTVGNNVRFDVDPNDFMDYTTFNDATTILDVTLKGRCDNNVFFGIVNMFDLNTYSLNNTFISHVRYSSMGIWCYNNIFTSTWDWSTTGMETQNNIMIGPCAYFNLGNYNSYNNTINFANNFVIRCGMDLRNTTFIVYNSFVDFDGGVFSSGIFLSGGIGSGFKITGLVSSSLIGYINGSGIIIDRILTNTSIYEKPLARLSLSSVNINLLPAPQGPVSSLGIDSEGNVVPGSSVATIFGTYAEIKALQDSSSLATGSPYVITDFQTIHQIQETTDINTAGIEPLMIIATSANTFGTKAYSALFPDDIIEYDFDDDLCEDDLTPRKGKILFRHDIVNKVSTHYDWRNVRFRRWKVTGRRDNIVEQLAGINQYQIEHLYFLGPLTDRRIHIIVNETITNEEGEIFVTIFNGASSIVRRIVKDDGNPIWLENEFSNKNGILVRDFENITDIIFVHYLNFASGVIERYAAWFPDNFRFAYGELSYFVDSEDYIDYLTFNGVTTKDVNIKSCVNKFPNAIGNNLVFISNVTGLNVSEDTFRCTFHGAVFHTTINSGIFFENYFQSNVSWCTFNGPYVEWTYFVTSNGIFFTGMLEASVIAPPQYITAIMGDITLSYIFNVVAGFTISGRVAGCSIFTTGSGSAGAVGAFTISNTIEGVYLGRFNANKVSILESLRSRTIFTLEQATTWLGLPKTERLQNYLSGPKRILGIDDEGYFIEYPHPTLEETVQAGASASITITHAPGVNPNDSATVGQLDQLEQDTIGRITTTVPALNNSAGVKGTFAYDADFIYVCIDTNSWLRSPRDTSF